MKSSASDRFWKCYAALPQDVKRQTKEAYAQFEKEPYYPRASISSGFTQLAPFSRLASASLDYRAIGIVEGDEITWFWIGSHSDYDNILKRLRNT